MSKNLIVSPDYIIDQRKIGWLDIHPEDYCHRCGTRNMPWTASRTEWLEATSAWAAETGREGICCPQCFSEMHEKQTGRTVNWELVDAASSDSARLYARIRELERQLKGKGNPS